MSNIVLLSIEGMFLGISSTSLLVFSLIALALTIAGCIKGSVILAAVGQCMGVLLLYPIFFKLLLHG